MGLEIQDVVVLTLLASVLNLIFGHTRFGVYMTFIPSLTMAVVLYVGKRGRPDKFLMHLIRYYITPGSLSSGEKSKDCEKKGAKIYEDK